MAIKVKQSTIDEIKKMGMTKALASAKTRRSPEFQEALRRMYGQRRLDAAMKGAQGGSASRETYMKRGYSSAPTSTGKSSPVKKGGGQGYKGTSKSQQQANNRNRAGAVAGAAAGVAAGSSLSRNIKSAQARVNVVNKANKSGMLTQKASKAKGVSKAAAAKNVMPTASRAAMTAASRLGLIGAAGVMAYKGARKAKMEADAAGRKVKAAGSGRTSAMASSIKKNRRKK